MPITPSMVLRHIKKKIGSILRVVPFTNKEMMDIVYDDSLYTFSEYFPYLVEKKIGRKDMDKYEKNVYYLSTDNEELEILGVAKIFRRGQGYFGTDGGYPILSSGNVFEAQLATDMMSMYMNPDSYKFHEPNKLEIFPKLMIYENILVELKCVHPKSFITIPLTLRRQFLAICEYDVKMAIWETLLTSHSI